MNPIQSRILSHRCIAWFGRVDNYRWVDGSMDRSRLLPKICVRPRCDESDHPGTAAIEYVRSIRMVPTKITTLF
eukprot:jgi/Psemu1/315122/fgenesh1_kg.1875_\